MTDGGNSFICPQCAELRVATKQLTEEFRRLAAVAKATNTRTADDCYAGQKAGEAMTWEQAAQMLEEKLNAD